MPDKLVTEEQDDMTLKLVIEAALAVSLGRLFRRIARDFRTVYAATGRILDADVYKSEVISILRPSYRRAARTAGKELRSNAEVSFPNDDQSEVEGEIDMNLLRFGEEESEESAEIISETTDRRLRNFVLATIVNAALIGLSPSKEEISRIAAGKFNADSRNRSRLIGVQEALNSVEGARLIESNGLLEGEAAVAIDDEEPKPLRGSFFREWISREDARVRPTHARAHGQRVFGTDEPFRVGTSLLMYPGDASLGASLAEIMNCRCYAATGITM